MLLSNVRIFDGVNAGLRPGHVLLADRRIRQVSSGPIAAPPGTTTIDGRGRVLLPGLTDAHWHMVFAPNTMANMEAADTGLMYANAVAEAERTLMRGFTTVRDTGGPTFGLKQAIDAGVIPGPRVYPSGALISQTAGHGDFGPAHDRPVTIGGRPSRFEEIGAFTVANGEAGLGVIQEGAWADVLLSEGDPTQDITVLEDYERNLRVIVKDGTVYKNTASAGS